ncbi:hypothetical protein EVAR_102368_1 [Eumeta japonica]|uniref:Uncharacterized protein n=1 Tax=Eumeta variegata TaxID=151549 RepID=A0A4C1SG88_EUMVA|nr:hypothetical protein EVAR_102368_1 [Eumeta japonica]
MTMEQTLMITPKQKDPGHQLFAVPGCGNDIATAAHGPTTAGSAGAAGGALQWKRTAIIPGDRRVSGDKGDEVYAAGPCRCQK